MKVKIELNKDLVQDEVIIRCSQIDSTIQKIEQTILDVVATSEKIPFYKESIQYYIKLEDVLFFETSENKINAHTAEDVYMVKYRLYELEELLPRNFIRISKSVILNTDQVYSIHHTITSPNMVQFYQSYKQVYVSRHYFKELKNRLDERRM